MSISPPYKLTSIGIAFFLATQPVLATDRQDVMPDVDGMSMVPVEPICPPGEETLGGECRVDKTQVPPKGGLRRTEPSNTVAEENATAAEGFSQAASADEAMQLHEIEAWQGVSIYALSRGRGVPEATLEALAQIRDRLASDADLVQTQSESRMGLEGETRLCVTFSSKEAALTFFDFATALAEENDLLNVTIERCE